jgi:hypothetical protein
MRNCVFVFFTTFVGSREGQEQATEVARMARQQLGKRALTTKYIALFSSWWHALIIRILEGVFSVKIRD